MKASEIEFLWCNPSHWKMGMFYFCPTDPRVIVPRLSRMGWTLNFARPLASPALIALLLALLGPFYLLARFNIDLHGYDWLLFAMDVFGVGLFCAWISSPRHSEKQKSHDRRPPIHPQSHH